MDELRHRTNELSRSVEELRALGEVSQAVNSTLDLETVLSTIVGRAVQLSHTDAGAIYVFEDDREEFRLHATYGMSETMIAAITDLRIGLGDSTLDRPLFPAQANPGPRHPKRTGLPRRTKSSCAKAILSHPDCAAAPPGHIVGALVVRRKTPGEFSQSTIELLQDFR